MTHEILGIHHVTAIASGAQSNVDFYSGLLGMRLVKKTVNFDDPGTYHFYYGDGVGTPGTILTFFPYQNARKGRSGAGQATAVALAIPIGSLDFWIDRLAAEAVHFDGPWVRFGENGVTVADPDGLQVDLVESAAIGETRPWASGTIPVKHAIRGIHSVTLSLADMSASLGFLQEGMGYGELAVESERRRVKVSEGIGGALDLVPSSVGVGTVAAGSIHHVAFRVENDEAQAEWREKLVGLGYTVSPVMDRDYFHSIYFREKGGVLFELATDSPGMLIDEDLDHLGRDLKLPAWLEDDRERIEKRLPVLVN